MKYFSYRYLKIREKYVLPLISYKVKFSDMETINIKYLLNNNITGASKLSNTKYKIFFNKEDLYKALIVDGEYFFTRAIVQYSNLILSSQNNSSCWNTVTQYYFSYFSATALLRYLHRGNIFLDGENARRISELMTDFIGEIIQLKAGNYTFRVRNESYRTESGITIDDTSDIYMELAYTANNGTHEQTWISIDELLNEMIAMDFSHDDELTILKGLKKISNDYTPTFPSKLRNIVNYRPPYGYKSIEAKLLCKDIEKDIDLIVKGILGFSNKDDENYKIYISQLYGMYFFILSSKLYKEYISRSGCEDKYIESKKEYFDKNGIEIPITLKAN